jgi:hypothetical protein
MTKLKHAVWAAKPNLNSRCSGDSPFLSVADTLAPFETAIQSVSTHLSKESDCKNNGESCIVTEYVQIAQNSRNRSRHSIPDGNVK